ncbi:MAG TPA: hypothetical protein VF222_04815 [Nitrososphaeraceae archaeon]
MKQLVIAIPFVMTFIYALTLPIEQYIVFGEENSTNSISERIILPYTIQTTTTTTTAVQQDGESDENEPITDLPVIDTPCKSPCPPTAEMCIFMCK